MDDGGEADGSSCLWLDQTPRPGWANMAIDQTLLDRAERQGESGSGSTGGPRSACPSAATSRPPGGTAPSVSPSSGVDTVRRPTGGRAVWHAEELTYAVAAPSQRFGSLPAAYREIHEMLADALRGLGARVALAPWSGPHRSTLDPVFPSPREAKS